MSDTTPIATVFGAQRAALETSQNAIKQSLDIQQRTIEAYTKSLDSQKSVQKQSFSASKGIVETYFDALEASLPANTPWIDEFRSSIEESYSAADEIHEDSWQSFEAIVTENVQAYEELSEGALEIIADSFATFEDLHGELESQAEATADAVDVDIE